MATIDLGKIKMVWRGAYDNATAYTPDDVVSSGGSSYICILASTGNAVSNGTYWQQMASKGTDADLLSIASTAQGDIYYNNGSAIARLAPGTANQVLQTGGAGANPSWGTMSSDFVLLSTDTITSSTANITRDVFSSTYETYKVIISGIRPVASGSSALYFRWRRAGSTLSDSAYFNHCHQAYYNGSSNGDGPHNENWGADYGRIYEQDHNTGGEYGGNYEFTIFNANSSTIVPQLVGLGTMYSNGGYHRHIRFSSWYQGSDKDVNGIHIFFNGQNILDGIIKIYGMK